MARDKAPRGHLVEELQGVGFSEYEARAYLSLLRRQPATAYEISKQAGLPRPNAYSALENLTNKGAVMPVSESPVRYVPVDPESLFQGIAAATSRRCEGLAEELANLDDRDATEYVWVVTGRRTIQSKIDEMIDNAHRHIWIKAPAATLERHLPALREAAERGIEIIIILFGPPASAEQFNLGACVTVYLHEGNGITVGLGDTLVTLTIDFEEALTVNTAGEGYGAHTRSRPVVNLAESLIRHEIYLAEIFQRFGAEIEEAFGPALVSLRQIYLPKEQAANLQRTIKDNAEHLRVIASQRAEKK
ncbi:TrmB family transcriptional regulator [Afifella sp. IM 167]|uniref:TrmB family transcriptional regulator n=1 Tax=Afifella sp. IM 167 TaxID=2033586 RepID=UPI001CD02AD3|nr:TrmB family transcriptional regulator [Afifella sp. IM 167]MBZ8132162.1 transcriptional regulator [Afifella sp. IM 167]